MENEIIHRLEKLERENRRMKKIGIVSAVVVSTLIIGGQAKTSKVVEANEFRLVDANGKVRAELSMLLTEPAMSLRDGNGEDVVQLGTYGGFPSLTLGKYTGSRAVLNAGKPESPNPFLSLAPGEGHSGFVNINAGTQNTLNISGPAGNVSVDTDEYYGPSLAVTDKKGYSINLGRADVEFPGTGRKERTPAASVVLFGKDKKVLWSPL
jgi:hypothetical protein